MQLIVHNLELGRIIWRDLTIRSNSVILTHILNRSFFPLPFPLASSQYYRYCLLRPELQTGISGELLQYFVSKLPIKFDSFRESLRRTESVLPLSQPDIEHHRPHRNLEAARTASRRSDLADLPLDLLSSAKSVGKSGIAVARSFVESSSIDATFNSPSAYGRNVRNYILLALERDLHAKS